MKATTIIIAALFTLSMTALFAGNESNSSFKGPTAGSSIDLTTLIPVTPGEATFEEVVVADVELDLLAPVVPLEAEFEEIAPKIDLVALSPVTPAEADFSDTPDQAIDNSAIAPTTPTVADFE